MRVISGSKKRYKLSTPKGYKIRPTSDQIKETLFNMIEQDTFGSCFVDLFSGTGQIGIEALSRGATSCVFIDKDRDAIRLIRENVSHVGFDDESTIIQGALPQSISRLSSFSPDIIFMDPPYDSGLYEDIFKSLKSLSSLTNDCLIIAESAIDKDFSFVEQFGFLVIKEKKYKSSKHVFIRLEEK